MIPIFFSKFWLYFAVARHLLDSEKWKNNIIFQNGKLDDSFVPEIPFRMDSAMNVLNYLNSAELNETFSDQCILELINTSANYCSLNPECIYEMVDRKGFGPLYVTTHRYPLLVKNLVHKWITSLYSVIQKKRNIIVAW